MGVAQDVHRFGFHMGVTAVGWVVYKAIEAPSSSLSKSRVYASSSLVLSLTLACCDKTNWSFSYFRVFHRFHLPKNNFHPKKPGVCSSSVSVVCECAWLQ